MRTSGARIPVLAVALVAAMTASPVAAQPAPRISVGIYAPTVDFGTAQARLAYVQALARAIEQSTGIKTDAQSYATIAALKKDNVDFAIVDAQCYATNLSWKLLATATVGGGTARAWALYAAGPSMQALRGKKLAYINTGCNDAGFIDNAMLDSEVDPAFFGARVAKLDLAAAVAEVASYRTAHAVFAPAGSSKGLTKVFDTGTLPNPAFVSTGRLPASVVDKVAATVTSYGGGGAISGWSKGSRDAYVALSGRFGKRVKGPMLATPELVRVDARDVLAEPASLRQPAVVDVRHHFVRPRGRRME